MPATPNKRKAADAKHTARAAVERSPFKQAKLESALSVEFKRYPENTDKDSAVPWTVRSMVRLTSFPAPQGSLPCISANIGHPDPKTIRPVPGGFEIQYSAEGFGMHMRGMSPTTIMVPGLLAKHLREQVLHAADTRNTTLGKTRADRMQGRFKEIMELYAKKDKLELANMTGRDEERVLNCADDRTYTCIGRAIRDHPFQLQTMSTFLGQFTWDSQATTLQAKTDGQMSIVFKDYSGRPVTMVSFKDVYFV